MRLPVIAAILFLSYATPARANLITVAFTGTLTGVSYPASTILAPGDPFFFTFVFRENVSVDPFVSTMTATIGPYAGLETYCPVCRLDYTALFAPTFLYANSFPNVGGLSAHAFSLTLNEGWQSGQFEIHIENHERSGSVYGQITRSYVVPEPATALMLVLGVGAALLRKRPPSGRSPLISMSRHLRTLNVAWLTPIISETE